MDVKAVLLEDQSFRQTRANSTLKNTSLPPKQVKIKYAATNLIPMPRDKQSSRVRVKIGNHDSTVSPLRAMKSNDPSDFSPRNKNESIEEMSNPKVPEQYYYKINQLPTKPQVKNSDTTKEVDMRGANHN